MGVFINGLLIGLAYVAPIGVQNIFIINTSLTQTRKKAFLTALIIIFFDVTLAFACFYGAGIIIDRITWIKNWILLIGGLVVVYIGYSILKDSKNVSLDKDVNLPISRIIITACVVTWFNPQALIDGTMLLGASKSQLDAQDNIKFISGVVSGSILWFSSIALILPFFKNKFSIQVLKWVNIICGSFIVIYGLKLILGFFG